MNTTVGQTVGYVRVSSVDQNLARQTGSLGDVDRMFTDELSGSTRDRPGLTELLQYTREGDTVRVHSMDRLARSLADLVTLVREMTAAGITVQFVKEQLTFQPGNADPYAEFQMHVLGAVAQLERSIIRERQAEGIAKAKARGVYKGRRPSLNGQQIDEARSRVEAGVPKAAVARDLGVSRQTLHTALKDGVETSGLGERDEV